MFRFRRFGFVSCIQLCDKIYLRGDGYNLSPFLVLLVPPFKRSFAFVAKKYTSRLKRTSIRKLCSIISKSKSRVIEKITNSENSRHVKVTFG
jgi:hypothetical protein